MSFYFLRTPPTGRSFLIFGGPYIQDHTVVSVTVQIRINNRTEHFIHPFQPVSNSQWPRGLGRMSEAGRLLRLWVRTPPGAWMSVCCECCVLSGRGLCDGLITRSEESYRLWRIVVCDLETPWMTRPWPTGGLSHEKETKKITYLEYLGNKRLRHP